MIAARPISEVQRPMEAAPVEQRRRHFHRSKALYLAAFMVLMSASGMGAFIFCTARMIASGEQDWGLGALAGVAAFLVFKGLAATVTHSLNCQLCQGKVLRDRGCRKHRHATKLPLITHRLSAVLSIVFTGCFTCMYCGTPYRTKK